MNPKRYHHGDLKCAITEAALAAVETGGMESVSLRACARNLGVDPAAVYRHFSGKEDLIAQVAETGFAALANDIEHALTTARSPSARLSACGAEYVRFAIRRPLLFRAMFTVAGWPGRRLAPVYAGGRSAYEILCASVAECGAGDQAPSVEQSLWSAVHGFADLCVLGLITPTDAEIDRRCRTFAERLLDRTP